MRALPPENLVRNLDQLSIVIVSVSDDSQENERWAKGHRKLCDREASGDRNGDSLLIGRRPDPKGLNYSALSNEVAALLGSAPLGYVGCLAT